VFESTSMWLMQSSTRAPSYIVSKKKKKLCTQRSLYNLVS